MNRGPLDLDVLLTPSTLKRQNINQVKQNSSAGVLRITPLSKVVWSEQCWSHDNKMAETSLSQQFIKPFIIAFPFKKK